MAKTYEYKCIDKSILTPFFRKYITAPTLEFIPKSINPNHITIVSFLFSLLGLYVAYYHERGVITNTVIALSIFNYLLFDHLDGMQAKRRGGGSPLGEFLDHFLDVLINGIITFTLVFLFDISNPIILIIIFASSYITQAAVFLEQRQSGCLYFGKIESLEAVLVLSLIIFLDGFDFVRSVLTENVYYGWRLIDWLLVISSISGLKVILESYSRIKSKILPLIIVVLTIGCFFYFSLSMTELNIPLLITVSLILVIQEYIIGHLTEKQFFVIEFLPIGLFLITIVWLNAVFVFIGMIALIVFIRFLSTVNELKKYKLGE